MTDGIEIRLGADTSAATSGTKDAAESIAASLRDISTALTNFGSKNKEVVEAAVKNNADLSRSFLELKGSLQGGFNAIAGVVERVRGVVGILAGALAGGMLWKSSIDEMLHLEDEVRTLEISLGATAQRATELAIALKLAGSNSDAFTAMAFKVEQRLRTNSEAFQRNKVATTDANGAYLSTEEILQNVYKRMQDFRAGTDQNLFTLEMVGRSARDFANDMSRLNAVQERAKQLVKEFGVELDQDKIEQYRIEVNAFKVALDETGNKIGAAVMPQLMGLARYFNDIGPTAVKYIVVAVKGLITGLEMLADVARTVGIAVLYSFEMIKIGAQTTARVMIAAATLQWGSIAGIVSDGYNRQVQAGKAAWAQIVSLWDAGGKRIHDIWNESVPTAAPKSLPRSGSEGYRGPPKAGADLDTGVLAALENELKAEQNAYNNMKLQQGSFETWSLEQTRNYWAAATLLTDIGEKAKQEIENKYYDADRALQQQNFNAYIAGLDAQIAAQGHNIEAKIALAEKEYQAEAQRYGATSARAQEAYKKIAEFRKQLADQVVRLAEIQAKGEEAAAKHSFDMARLSLDQQLALRQINVQQQLAIEKTFLDQEYAQEKAFLDRRLALLRNDPTSDPAKAAEIEQQLLVLYQNYETKKTQIANAAELDRKKIAIDAANDVQNRFATLFDDLTSRTKSAKQAFSDFIKGITADLNKLAADNIAKQLFGAGTTGGNFLNDIFGKIFGVSGGASGAASSGAPLAAAGTTLQTAGVTLETAGTTLSTAGPTLMTAGTTLTAAGASLEAAAAALQVSGAFGGGSPFAGGGFGIGSLLGLFPGFAVGTPYVPKDMLAMVHKGEAVIPAAMNKPGVRGGSFHQTIVFNHSGPIDRRTEAQIMRAAARGAQYITSRDG